MTNRKAITLSTLMISIAIILVGCNSNSVANAPKPSKWSQRGIETLDAIGRDFTMKTAGAYYEDQNRKAVGFSWSNSMLLLAYAKAAQFDKAKYEKPLDELINHIYKYWQIDKGIGGYDHLPGPKKPVERYYDDNAWLAMGLLDAYDATGKKQYLKQAELTVKFCLSGMDDTLGGGIWWREFWPDKTKKTKNTCSVAPIAYSCLRMYQCTKEQLYLDTAKELMVWLDKTLLDKDNIYWDAIGIDGKIAKRKWSYNTGMPLQCYVLLYTLTEQEVYLDKAKAIAKAAQSHWVDKQTGAINCEAMFAFTLTEGWCQLAKAAKEPQWQQLSEKALTFVYTQSKDPNNRYPKRWDLKTTKPLKEYKPLFSAPTARAYFIQAD
ncbi:MAG: AGE family epimerase/isomerase [Phycisphaerae bacterium]|nr:AGE family epimerase/isomerase [Phycisphaerae bacterium]